MNIVVPLDELGGSPFVGFGISAAVLTHEIRLMWSATLSR